MLSDLAARGALSPTTQRHAYSVIRIALGHALRQGKVIRNVCTVTDPPRRATVEMQPLTRDEAWALIEGTRGEQHHALYLLALGSGARQGELLGLRWQDVDLERGEVTIQHSLGRFTRELAPTKTDRSRRTLRLPGQVIAALVEQRERQAVVPMSGLLFTTAAGGPLHAVNVTLSLQRTLRRLGLPKRRFHDLRHTFATLALEAGEDLSSVSRALGHTSVATTADVYGHWTPAMQVRLAARMEAVLSG